MEVERTQVVPDTQGTAVQPGPAPPVELARPTGLADWRGDVALELWVEVDVEPAESGGSV